ncbi:hypothetical protein C8R48DRAFT_782755 [Suillus tomentosus]|nr:hypothetical protein C8R48DRAFT_782755 [Suillus tomentosus]
MAPLGLVKRAPTKVLGETDGFLLSNIWWQDLVRDGDSSNYSQSPKSLHHANLALLSPRLRSLDEVKPLVGKTGLLVNATALGSRSLMDVEDTAIYPIRGQSIIVERTDLEEFVVVRSELHTTITSRPGLMQMNTVSLGGTYQVGSWDTSLDMSVAKGIFERCSVIAPCLKEEGTKILMHTVALRPDRKGGPHVEAERISLPLVRSDGLAPNLGEDAGQQQDITVIHAYGMGAAGYQRSWGVAFEVLSLLKVNM